MSQQTTTKAPLPQDPMLKFRSVIRGKNSKGGDRSQLYLAQEQALALIEVLQANIENPRGVKLDLHISKKESQDGRAFDSAIMFVKAVQEASTVRPGGGFQKAPAPYMEKVSSPEDIQARIERTRNQFKNQ